MTRLNIEGQMVDIDDGFMKMSPEDQNATGRVVLRPLLEKADVHRNDRQPLGRGAMQDHRAVMRHANQFQPLER